MANKYFKGLEVSTYGAKNNRVDLETLSKIVGGVLDNEIMEQTDFENWEIVNGSIYTYYDNDGNEYNTEEALARIEELNEEIYNSEDEEEIADMLADIERLEEPDHTVDIFQYLIISKKGADLLKDESSQIVLFNRELNVYVWCITTYGTAWNYVLTDIKLS